MAWQTPIFDRTQLDVDYVKELSERIYTQGFSTLSANEQMSWMSGLKGALNSIDLNRIEGNIEYLAEVLTTYAYVPPISTIKTDWHYADLNNTDSIATINRVSSNALSLINAFYPMATQPPNNLINPLYSDINKLEKFLLEMKDTILRMEQSFVFSGTINAAESLILPQWNGGV